MRQVIIVAGGIGKRMGSELPKQFIEVNGKPIVVHTIEKFKAFDSEMGIIVVLPAEWIAHFEQICIDFRIECVITAGGSERFHSVQNGLAFANADVIAVHDAVRPLVSLKTIQNLFDEAEKSGAAIPVVPVAESIRKVEGAASIALNRTNYRLVQTPQVFRKEVLTEAYWQEFRSTFTDDASVVEASGHPVSLVDGNSENIKITTPMDLQWMKLMLP